MRILGRTTSINVRKVLWTATEIGLAYDHEDRWATSAAPSQSTEFLRLNPNGLVPVIEDEGAVLWESNTICRYLAAKHARLDLLPAEPAARAEVEKWMDWQIGELNGAWRYAFLALVRKAAGFDDEVQIARSLRAWNHHMRILDEQLQVTGAYATGRDFTLADIPLALSIHRWRATPLDHASAPAIDAYMERLRDRPAFGVYCAPAFP